MDAASVEQMNRLRKSLGLPLLPTQGTETSPTEGPTFRRHESDSSEDEDPASTLETREAAGYGNWQELQDANEAKKRREAKIAALKKARDASQRFLKLEGKGLGDVGKDGDLDAKSWLKSQNKRMKQIEAERAERTARELEERERLAAVQYRSSDLAGVHIAHELEDFGEEEGEQILTLKDKAIDDEGEEDELEARELVAKENLQKRLDSKRKKPAYDVHEENSNGERKILSQYDENQDRKRKLTLDSEGNFLDSRDSKKQAVGNLLKSINLGTIFEEAPASDYLAEVRIKKPKKIKKQREKLFDDDIFSSQDVLMTDSTNINQHNPQQVQSQSLLQDDDDLQLALASSRKAAFKKKARMRPEDLAKELRAESPTMSNDGDAADGLIIDETSEFVQNLQVSRPEAKLVQPRGTKSLEPDDNMSSPSDEEPDTHMGEASDVTANGTNPALENSDQTAPKDMTATGLEDEEGLDQGIGAALHLLRQRGLVNSSDGGTLSQNQLQREIFLQEKRRRETESERQARAQREQERKAGTYDRMSAKDRQDYARFENSRREQVEQRSMAEFFNSNYRPNVELKYVDETGRSLDAKEAFKHLSHQFHGKGSGKQKTEKRIKKVEEEKKREAMSMLDSSQATGMNNAQGTTAKKNKQAGVRLA